MTRVNPQPGKTYKVICADDQDPHKEVIFTFINITPDGRYEIKVNGEVMVVGDFCQLCHPWACEVHSI